jgi:hypothetical protein
MWKKLENCALFRRGWGGDVDGEKVISRIAYSNYPSRKIQK